MPCIALTAESGCTFAVGKPSLRPYCSPATTIPSMVAMNFIGMRESIPRTARDQHLPTRVLLDGHCPEGALENNFGMLVRCSVTARVIHSFACLVGDQGDILQLIVLGF